MADSHADAWKFWVKTRGHIYCYIATIGDERAAEDLLRSREAIGELLDRERLPQRVYDVLELKPNEVVGFQSMRW